MDVRLYHPSDEAAVIRLWTDCGLGRSMMAEAERRLRDAGCPKINLQVRKGNRAVIAFYRQLGFNLDDAISLGKRLEPAFEQRLEADEASFGEHMETRR